MFEKIKRYFIDEFDIYEVSTDIFHWSIISIVVGLLVGTAVSLALNALEYAIEETTYWFVFLPFVLSFVSYITYKTFRDAVGDGTEEIVRAAIYGDRRLNFINFIIKQAATFTTIIFGGSVGKEAPSAQIGAYISHLLSKIFHIDRQKKIIIIITGTSAGFAVVFGAPIAAGFFALEALFAGKIIYRVLVPSLISSFVAFWCMHIFEVEYIYHPIFLEFVPNLWELVHIFKAVLAGIAFGIVAYIVIISMRNAQKIAQSDFIHPAAKGFLGGMIIVILALIFGERYLGLGLEDINMAFNDSVHFSLKDPLLKDLFTSLTIASGGSGGFVTPIFYIGSTFGNFFATFMDSNIKLYAALGFVSVLSGATNSPIASTILAAELFGVEAAHFAAVTSTIAYLISSRQSVFSPEILETIERKFKKHIKS